MTNPYLIQGPALISFSGGRTSAFMLKHILDAHGGTLPADVHVAFANTGREMPETLDFVQECSDRWGVRIVWLEFDPEEPHQTKIVSHNSASRNGEPLTAAIRTRPTPHLFNRISAYCTGMTKQKRLDRFARHWCCFDTWHSVRGIRHDEPRRVKSQRVQTSPPVLLPLDDAQVVGADIAAFWDQQPFDLRLPGRDGVTELGNCVLCPRKSRARLIRILRDNPEAADIDWWLAHERQMGERVKDIPRNRPELPEMRNRFLLGGESYADLARIAAWQRENPEPKQVDLFEEEESLDCACTD